MFWRDLLWVKLSNQNTLLGLIVELVSGISTPLLHKSCAAKPFLPISNKERTWKIQRDQNNKMTKKNTQSCQIALNIFKMSEFNFKNQLDLLQTAI